MPVQINMQVNAQLIQERFNKLAEEIQSRALAEPKAILNSTALPSSEQQLPNGETLPEPSRRNEFTERDRTPSFKRR